MSNRLIRRKLNKLNGIIESTIDDPFISDEHKGEIISQLCAVMIYLHQLPKQKAGLK